MRSTSQRGWANAMMLLLVYGFSRQALLHLLQFLTALGRIRCDLARRFQMAASLFAKTEIPIRDPQFVVRDVVVRRSSKDLFEAGSRFGVHLLIKIRSAEISPRQKVLRIAREQTRQLRDRFVQPAV